MKIYIVSGHSESPDHYAESFTPRAYAKIEDAIADVKAGYEAALPEYEPTEQEIEDGVEPCEYGASICTESGYRSIWDITEVEVK